jgi:hypothetical protein
VSTDEQRLAEIRARAEAATPGEWLPLEPLQAVILASLRDDGTPDEGHSTSNIGLMVGPMDGAVAVVSITVLAAYPYRDDVEHDPLWSDAAFIAHSRADVPWLLEQLAEAEQQLGTIRDLAGAQPGESTVDAVRDLVTEWDHCSKEMNHAGYVLIPELRAEIEALKRDRYGTRKLAAFTARRYVALLERMVHLEQAATDAGAGDGRGEG